MDKAYVDLLSSHGVDVERTLERFLNNEVSFIKYFEKFPEDTNFSQLKKSIDKGDLENAYSYGHTLRGLCANLGLIGINEFLYPLVEDLKKLEYYPEKHLMEKVEERYNELIKIIIS